MRRQPVPAHTPFVDLAAQRERLGGTLEQACLDALGRSDYILGEAVSLFEEEFAAYCGTRHAIGVDSGTSALELALRAHEIGPGDEVITVANTFIATPLAIAHSGATPVLVDAEPATYNIDPALVSAAIGPRTRAIVPVHLYGQAAEMAPIRAIAEAHGLAVIEDACQAHGAREAGHRAGTLGDAAAFSFYPSKNLGAYGDGGIVVTNDDGIAERVRRLRNYGSAQKYRSEELGYNRRLDTLQAAMLRVKLPHLDRWNEERRSHARFYEALLAELPLELPAARPGVEHVWHLYVVRVPEREAVIERLAARRIESGIHYPIPVHLQPAFSYLGYGPGDFPVSEAFAGEVLSLPMYPELPDESLVRIAEALHDALEDSGPLAERAA